MIFKAWKMLELPTPLRVGTGMFEAWREDCRRAWEILPLPTDKGDDVRVTVSVDAEVDSVIALTTLAWAVKLIREDILEPGRKIREYTLNDKCPLPGKITVNIGVYGLKATAPALPVSSSDEESEAA